MPQIGAMITEIVPALFIGNVADAQDAQALHGHNIQRVISLIDQDDIHEFTRVPGIAYELRELWDGDAPTLLRICLTTGLDARPTLVHCAAGLSRSVSFVAYHLCRSGVVRSPDEAYALIEAKQAIAPHRNFVRLLRRKLH